MATSDLANDLLRNIGGIDENNLNSILQIDSRHDDQIETFNPSNYYDIDSFIKVFENGDQMFTTLSLNIESINAKFNQLTSFMDNLNEHKCEIDAIFIQETWLTDQQCNSNIIQHYHVPGYHTITLGSKCGRKGGAHYLSQRYLQLLTS